MRLKPSITNNQSYPYFNKSMRSDVFQYNQNQSPKNSSSLILSLSRDFINYPLFGLVNKQNIVIGNIIGLIGLVTMSGLMGYCMAKKNRIIKQTRKSIRMIKKIKSYLGSLVRAKGNHNKQKLRILLIRHAEIDVNAPKTFMSPLSDNGLDQAQALGRRLMIGSSDGVLGFEFDLMVSSPTIRTYDTCQVVKEYLKNTHPILISNNISSRISKKELYSKIGQRVRMFLENEINENLPEIVKNNNSMITVGIFTHGLAIKALLQDIYCEKNDEKVIQIENGSITELLYDPENDEWTIIRINDFAHCEHLLSKN